MLGQSLSIVSSDYFKETLDENISLAKLDALLVSKEVNGYFILPNGFPFSDSSIQFVTSELNDSNSSRSAYLLKNWFMEVATKVISDESKGPASTENVRHSQLTITTNLSSPRDLEQNMSDTNRSFESQLQPKYLNLWVRSIWVAMFWITMLYSIYVMSFNTTEEKQSRIAEVLLSSVSSLHLMDGKVWGNVLIILTVCSLWLLILGVPMVWIIALAPELGSFALRELFQPIYILNWIVFLVIGVTMFGYILTAAGALFSADRVLTLVNSVLVVFFGIGLITTLDPHTVVASVVSFIPPITPFAMVSQTTSLPPMPVYFALLTIVLLFLCAIRYFLVLVFARGMFLEAVPGKISRLIRALLVQR